MSSTSNKSTAPPSEKQMSYAQSLASSRAMPLPVLRTRAEAHSFITLAQTAKPLATPKQVELIEGINSTCVGIPYFQPLDTCYLEMERANLFIGAWGHFHTPSPKLARDSEKFFSLSKTDCPVQFGRVTQRSAAKYCEFWMRFCGAQMFSWESAYRISLGLIKPGVADELRLRMQTIQEILYDETIEIVDEGADLRQTLLANDRLIDAEMMEERAFGWNWDRYSSELGKSVLELQRFGQKCTWVDDGISIDGFVVDVTRRRYRKSGLKTWKIYRSLGLFSGRPTNQE